MFSFTVSVGNNPLLCGTWVTPHPSTSAGAIPVMSLPSSRIRPALGFRMPLTARNTVDFPAPFGPTMQPSSPTPTSRSTPCSTFPPP